MKKPRLLVVGSSNTDMIIKMPRIPRPGETLLGGDFVIASGGKGANQAVAATRSGGDVTFVARVGDDMFGKRAFAAFKADGINVRHVVRDKRAPSGVALIFVADSGENSIGVASGANGTLSPKDIRNASGVFKKSRLLILQLETPLDTVTAAARLAKKHNVPVILNPAPATALPTSLLKLVSIVTPNETEAELLTGIKILNADDAARAGKALLRKGVKTVIITLGSQGAFLCNADICQLIPGFKVKAVDTTAAGDTFNGALAVALAEGSSLTDAVCFANAAAAISVTRLGAQPSVPTRAEIEAFIKKNARKAKQR